MVTAIVGANWGDEGKGKMTDLLSEHADIVVRFQGGANAGHTIKNDLGKFALHLLPSGVLHPNVVNVISAGVALNPIEMFAELDDLAAKGLPAPKLLISDRVQLLCSYHIRMDGLEEERLGKSSFGSTRSGIAPFYSDKYSKIGIQIMEIYDEELLRARISRTCELKNNLISDTYHTKPLDPEEIYREIVSYRDRLRPYICDTTVYLNEAIKAGKNILLEGQLGSLKDPDHGIYPFVTSSSPLAGFASVSAGIPARSIERVVTICKAYSSAVGAGDFVTEIFGDEASELRDRGGDCGEYGATTGRPRRMGWFDCVASRYGCMLQGTTDVVLSLLDVLGYLDRIPVCVAYEVDGKYIKDFPPTPMLRRAKPIYEYLAGWRMDISEIRRFDDLPKAAKEYVLFVEKQLGYPITMISNGSRRDDIIYR